MPLKTVIYTTTGNSSVTLPADCALISLIECIGGGASGGGSFSGCIPSAGSGGGGGGYAANNTGLAVTAGGTAFIQISGATGGNFASGGNSGGTTWFNIAGNFQPGNTSQGAVAGGGNAGAGVEAS